MSRKASVVSVSVTTVAGISPATMRQNRQSVTAACYSVRYWARWALLHLPSAINHGRVKGAKLLVIVRCLISFAIGVLLLVLAIRFGEALWRAVQ
ncbi:hypothetical protein GCM10010178_38260 [Lentzea flava]|uniref:Uncharacterized protein n=1 Tax=Lentzea flava TaxID=103732 RepID=A0ABQ2UKQ0_9PSEU|nr:hypothetical protein GCM10010178_38260 [Lentzea flava]